MPNPTLEELLADMTTAAGDYSAESIYDERGRWLSREEAQAIQDAQSQTLRISRQISKQIRGYVPESLEVPEPVKSKTIAENILQTLVTQPRLVELPPLENAAADGLLKTLQQPQIDMGAVERACLSAVKKIEGEQPTITQQLLGLLAAQPSREDEEEKFLVDTCRQVACRFE